MKRVALPTLLICSLSSVFVCESSSPYRVSLAPYAPDAGHHGLYLFRIPVSVLPGREITEGNSAVPTLRAQLQVDQAHLPSTFPKMLIADLVEALTPRILADWNDAKEQRKTIAKLVKDQGGVEKLSATQLRALAASSYSKKLLF